MEEFPKVAHAAIHRFEEDCEVMMFESINDCPTLLEDGQEVVVYDLREVKKVNLKISLEDIE